jgi:ATP-dependent DNA helicase PIF1
MNKGKRWTDSENNLLINSIINNNKNTLDNISVDLGRSKYAVIKQLEKILLQKNIDCNLIYEQLLITNIKSYFNSDSKIILDQGTIQISNNIQNNLVNNEINNILDDIINEIEETSQLNHEQLLCYQNVKNNKNILITGSGGSGKSHILKCIIKYLKRKNKKIGITSSTGISATLINGTTIHSFLKIGLAKKPAKELYEKIKLNTPIYNKLKKLEVLIIDEISMIDNILFNKIAAYLSLIKEIKKPFGKIQLILCGDFYKLPPIENTYCFNSSIWNKLNLIKIELKKQMRQINDQYFQYILEQVKINNITDDIFSKLSELKNKNIDKDIKPTILYSKNIDVDQINQNEFLNLANKTNNKIYEYSIKYDITNSKIKKFIKNNTNFLETIKLCKGLQIMVTYNLDLNNKITNGTRGIIVDINELYIKIKTLNGSLYNVEYIQYINELDNTITFKYIPLKLAYAITIHKAQGQTLDYIQINLGKDIFDYGMAYVALSRAKTLDSIILSDLSKSAFKTNLEVIEFYKKIIE